MVDEQDRLREIMRLSTEMAQIKDLDLLMERILTEARRFVNGDAGTIYLKVGDKLEFTYTQNETLRRRLPEEKKLIYHTFSLPIDHSTIAGYVAATGLELNIPNVGELSPDLPYKFGIEFDEAADYHTQSMFTLPLKTIRKDTVGVLQIINAQDEAGEIASFSDEDLLLIRHFATSAATALERAQMTRTFFLRMIRMTELRDPKETASHVIRVGAYSTELYEVWARAQGLAEKEIKRQRDILRLAAMLHDVGKVGIVDRILKKPAPLTREEYEIMQGHTLIGTQLFADPKSDFEEAAALVALNHHERWDGKGYPGHVDPTTGLPLDGRGDGGKKGEEIPLLGRIVAIADVYDALCSTRSYKNAWQEENVLEEMRKESGKQFDPELLTHFFSILDLVQSIKTRYPDLD